VSLDPERAKAPEPIHGLRRVHCGYHKSLTMYFRRVFERITRGRLGYGSFRHFQHRLEDFYRECGDYTFSSISGHAIDLDRFEDVRVTRFIRDPRDLVVSGYHYHKRSPEGWCDVVDPTDEDWFMVRGAVPLSLPNDRPFARYLNEVSPEEGLAAEMEFRRYHFESMMEWPDDDPRIRLFRYEEILGNEPAVFDAIFRFYELPFLARRRGLHFARKLSASRRWGKYGHIRDPRSGQWREHFTPALTKRFNADYGGLLEKLGYPAD
jgi:hypothetical protein